MPELKKILETVRSYLPHANFTRIEEAYHFAKKAHEGQLRFSGEPYFVHPVAATLNLLTLNPDEDTIIACLLHDVVEDTESDIQTIEKKFGKTVAKLCLGMEKLGKVRYHGQERQIENLRKMFVAMADDLRVIFIKLADRIHNMETINYVRPDKQTRIARETLEVYAPIAARLGIYEFKSKLEDLAFKNIYPKEYRAVEKTISGTAESREKIIETAKKQLRGILKKEGIEAEILGRTKHLYSIWRKLKLKGYTSVNEIYDLFALRVITQTPADCYAALGIIHKNFTPLSHRFKDFIAVPKSNGYQSLHTTVIGLNREAPTEIQIRTEAMHAEAERGAAAHWQYSEKKKSVKASESKLKWIKGLVELHERLQDNIEFAETLTSDVLEDRIFVLTPGGDVMDLPAGATPVDFAYTVHTEVGNTCVGAKINGKIAKLDAELHNGEVVEILTKKDSKPNRFWLSFAKTSSARGKIKAYFSALDQSENLMIGKDLINKHLARLGKASLDSEYAILKDYKKQNLSKPEREILLERIGNGSVSSKAVIRDLFNFDELVVTKPHRKPVAPLHVPASKKDEVEIEGVTGIAVTFAKCCKPASPKPIVAVMGRRGAMIHREDCKQIERVSPDRKLAARWFDESTQRLITIVVGGKNRVGLLRDIAATIAEQNINIADLALKKSDQHEILHELTIEVADLNQLNDVLDKLEKIEGVTKAAKV